MNVNIRLIIVGVVVVAIIGAGAYYFTLQNKPMYSLGLQVTGSGSVSKSPDQSSYAEGTVVTLTTTPTVGYTFKGWSGDFTGTTNPATITMNAAKTVTATFTAIEYTLSTSVSGSGSIAKNPSKTTYQYGEVVQLTTTPSTGYSFTAWSGDLSGSANPASITVNGNKAVTATFTQNQYLLTVTTIGSGSVAKLPDKATYIYSESVQLTATPAVGYTFTGWSGDLTGTANPASVTMDAAKTITATFTAVEYTLTVSISGSGSVAKSPIQSAYTSGTILTLTASPSAGYTFTGWSGDLTGTANPASVTMDAEKTITATFAVINNPTHSLVLQVTGSGQIIINGVMGVDYATFSEVNDGGVFQLSASPAEGWKFIEWTGDMSGNTNPILVVMTKDMKITAVFTK